MRFIAVFLINLPKFRTQPGTSALLENTGSVSKSMSFSEYLRVEKVEEIEEGERANSLRDLIDEVPQGIDSGWASIMLWHILCLNLARRQSPGRGRRT